MEKPAFSSKMNAGSIVTGGAEMQIVAIAACLIVFLVAFGSLVAERRQAQLIPVRVKRNPR